MISNERKEFIRILGDFYEDFGYPRHYAFIEAILWLESPNGGWTQKTISEKLSELFPNTPTSISSIHRALKILENYSVVTKEGSRKGYTYRVNTSGLSVISGMMDQLTDSFESFLKDITFFKDKTRLYQDPELQNVVEMYTVGMEYVVRFFEDTKRRMEADMAQFIEEYPESAIQEYSIEKVEDVKAPEKKQEMRVGYND